MWAVRHLRGNEGFWVGIGLSSQILSERCFVMAAWTSPDRITDWCENLTTDLKRCSREDFVTVVLGNLLAKAGGVSRVGCKWLAFPTTGRFITAFLQTVGWTQCQLSGHEAAVSGSQADSIQSCRYVRQARAIDAPD